MYEPHEIPEEFANLMPQAIRRIPSSLINSLDLEEPALIHDVPEFHRLETSRAVKQLLEEFGDCDVPLDCGKTMKLKEWRESVNRSYLKDWHINQSALARGLSPIFSTPPIFRDWLSSFHSENSGIGKLDFLFLYWGTKGSCTGFHEDVVGTYSWSLNIRGRKLWRFYMHGQNGSSLIECFQEPGEMVFVPSGCFHTVMNLEDDTISINQNWFNETNICAVVDKVVQDYKKVSEELREFGVSFSSETERMRQIDLLVGSNNCINIPILMKIFFFILASKDLNDAAAQNAISVCMNKMSLFAEASDQSRNLISSTKLELPR